MTIPAKEEVKRCSGCGKAPTAHGRFAECDTEDRAHHCNLTPIELWNRRPIEDELRAELQKAQDLANARRASYLKVADAIAPDSTGPDDLAQKVYDLRAELAKTKAELESVCKAVERLHKAVSYRRDEFPGVGELLVLIDLVDEVRRSGGSAAKADSSPPGLDASATGPATTKPTCECGGNDPHCVCWLTRDKPACNLGTPGCVRDANGHDDKKCCCFQFRPDEDDRCASPDASGEPCGYSADFHLPQPIAESTDAAVGGTAASIVLDFKAREQQFSDALLKTAGKTIEDIDQRVANCEAAIRMIIGAESPYAFAEEVENILNRKGGK